MVKIELTDEEALALEPIFARFLIAMDREIVHTDSKEYKNDLKMREEVLRHLADRLKAKAA